MGHRANDKKNREKALDWLVRAVEMRGVGPYGAKRGTFPRSVARLFGIDRVLPCPFCGRPPKLYAHPEPGGFTIGCDGPYCPIGCAEFKSVPTTIRSWNRRREEKKQKKSPIIT